MSSTLTRALCALLIAAVVPPSISAQMVEAGIARDVARGTPYECLHVALLDSAGKAIAHTVTDSAGRFLLEAPRPGVYRVQFDVFHWEPLVVPVDTLREGVFKQRAYPLAFSNMRVPDSAFGGPEVHGFQERYKLFDKYLRDQESDSGWRSRQALPGKIRLHFQEGMPAPLGESNVVGRFIVDSTGKARGETWYAIAAPRPDFERLVANSIPEWRWKPARNRGQPVCELAFDVIHFFRDAHGQAVWFEVE
jgi:hypothetical protein